MFIVAKYKNLTNTAKYIYIYIKLHTWPSIESNEITVSFREEEIKNFPSRVNSTSFLPSYHSSFVSFRSRWIRRSRRGEISKSLGRDIAALNFLQTKRGRLLNFVWIFLLPCFLFPFFIESRDAFERRYPPVHAFNRAT